MKTKDYLSLLAIIIMSLAGCIPSLHPLYSDNDRIRMDEISGTWMSDDSSSLYRITQDPGDPFTYLFNYIEIPKGGLNPRDSGQALFEVNLVRLGHANFMDFFPGENRVLDDMSILLAIHLVPAHTFARFSVSGDTMTIWRFNPDWLEKLFDENRIRISHENVGDQIVLTASTEELQKFISKYSYDQEAYVDPEILIRSGS